MKSTIRRILKEIEEDRVQIRLGRNANIYLGRLEKEAIVQNIIISVDGEDITSEDDVIGLGKMNIVITDDEIVVGDIIIPEEYRGQGISTTVYQKISDYFGLPLVDSTTKGFDQTKEGGYIWKNRDNFKPRNLQESIRRILREEVMGLNESFFDWFKKSEKNLGRPYNDDFEEERFTCEDCGEKNYNMYMVNDDLWKEYGNEKMTLCKSCLEKRMDRELNKDDISQHYNALTNIHNPDLKHFY